MGAHDPRSAQDRSTVHNLCSPVRTTIIVHLMTKTTIIVHMMTRTNLGDEKIELLLSWSLGLRESGTGFGRSDIKLKTVALIMMLRRGVIDNGDLEMD